MVAQDFVSEQNCCTETPRREHSRKPDEPAREGAPISRCSHGPHSPAGTAGASMPICAKSGPRRWRATSYPDAQRAQIRCRSDRFRKP